MKHITITKQLLNGVELNSVSGRDLHKNLEVKKAFTTWITSALDTMGSIEGEDYLKLKTSLSGSGYQWDYILTLDLAKHIAMMSKVSAGKKIRQYFIDVEEQERKRAVTALSDNMHKLQALFNTQEVMGEVVTEHEKRINNLEKNTRLESWQEKTLLDAKNRKVYELARNDDKLAKKLHGNIWREFKKRFHIPRYSELTIGRYDDGLTWLENVQLHEVV